MITSTGLLRSLALISATAAGNPPLVHILTDTGRQHNGIAVAAQHPDAKRYESVLLKGFSRTLLHVYFLEQRVTHPNRPARPAYLVLTDNQGGFPRTGFELDGEVKSDVAFVDLHRRSELTGRFGAIDQIFPHELMHIIVEDFAGPPPDGHASQVHAVGVQTDRGTAFNEGVAEAGQILSIDDPDVSADTHALASNAARYADARARFDEYYRAMTSRWNVGTRARMTFPLWFSQSEQVLRYHAVRENAFSRSADFTRQAVLERRWYDAYLVENTVVAPSDAPSKSAARMVATEGVVATLFWRLLSSPVCRASAAPDDFYVRFGTTRAALTPSENVLLKFLTATHAGGYDAIRVLRAYIRQYPAETAEVNAIVSDVLRGQPLPDAPELWVRNASFQNGRSLFDQTRAIPRPHSFDLNAASRIDLMTVPGMDAALASQIMRHAPFQSVDDLATIPGMTPALVRTFARLRAAIDDHGSGGDSSGLTLKAILEPYLWRALTLLGVATLACALLYRLVRPVRWWRLVLNGLAAAFGGLLAGWSLDPGTGAFAFVVPLALFGMPATAIRLWRTRSLREALQVTAAWTLASLIPAMIVRPA